MTKKNAGTTLEAAKDILSACLFIPADKIDENADIRSIAGMDSLTFELVLLEIEKYTGEKVDPARLLSLQSVGDLAQLLEKTPQQA